MLNEDIGNGPSDRVYVGDGIVLVPYADTSEGPSISDPHLIDIWQKAVEDNVHITVWDESVRSIGQFLNFVKDPNNLIVFIYSETWSPLGMAWVNGVQRNYAFGHFFFLKEAWGRKTLIAGQRVLKYWFEFPGEDGPLFDVIIGNIPEKNRHATAYIKRLGFKTLGSIPHIADGEAMSVNYIER